MSSIRAEEPGKDALRGVRGNTPTAITDLQYITVRLNATRSQRNATSVNATRTKPKIPVYQLC